MSGGELLLKKTRKFRTILMLTAGIQGMALIIFFLSFSLLLLVFFDWLLKFTRALRLLAFFFLVGGGIYCIRKDILYTLRHFNSFGNIARYIEKLFPLHDVYESALYFLAQPVSPQNRFQTAMLDKLYGDAADLIGGIRQVRVIDRSVLVKNIMKGLGGLALFSLLFYSFPQVKLGVARILFPLTDYAWPVKTTINVITQDIVHPRGETLLIEAVAGGSLPRGCVIVIRKSGSRKKQKHTMVRFGKKWIYKAVNITHSIEYCVKGGDARSPWYKVNVVDRPFIDEMYVTYTFPQYTGLKVKKERVDNFDIPFLAGSVLAFSGRSSKKLIAISIKDENNKLFEPDTLSDYEFTWTVIPERNRVITFLLKDEQGFTQSFPSKYHLWLEKDTLPDVKLVNPAKNRKVLKDAVVPVEIRVFDNFGIKDISLVYAVQDARRIKLKENTETWQTEGDVSYRWEMRDFGFKEGDRVILWGEAFDFNPASAQLPGASGKVVFEIIPPDDLSAIIQRKKVAIKHLVEGLIKAQTTFVMEVREAQAEELYELESKQEKILVGLQNTASEIADLSNDHLYNNLTDSSEFATVEDIEKLIKESRRIASETVLLLRKASLGNKDSFGDAKANEEKILDLLKEAAEKMADWELFEYIISKLKQLITWQEGLARKTIAGAGTIPRTAVENLDKDEKDQIQILVEEQTSFMNELERIASEIEKGIDVVGKSEKKKTFKRAIRFIHKKLLYKKMETVIFNVNQNRMFSAYTLQRDIIILLKELVEIISGKKNVKEELRALQEILKGIGSLGHGASDVLSQQKEINKEFTSGLSKEELLQREKDVQKKMEELLKNLDAFSAVISSRSLKTLAKIVEGKMSLAEAIASVKSFSEFVQGLSSKGRSEGKSAEEKLKELIKKLKEAAKAAAKEESMLRREDIIESLKAVLEVQEEIGGKAEKICREKINTDLSRDEMIIVNEIIDKEKLNRNAVEEIIRVISKKRELVFVWTLKNIKADMEKVIESFERREIGDTILFLNQQIIDNVKLVLKSLDLSRKKAKKARGGSSGMGGGGGGSSPELIPPVLELKLLREIQDVVNRETEKYFKKERQSPKVLNQLREKQGQLMDFFRKLLKGK